MFAPSSEQLTMFRSGGVTAVGLMFSGGLFPGRVGAAMTGGHDESKLVLRSSIGQQVSFGSRRGGYPGTGIGAVAFVKQSILDAQYEHRVEQAFLAGTAAGRPTMDPFKRALIPAASNEMSLWFVASNERQLIRVTEIAEELGLQKWVVAGAQEGWRVISSLQKSGGPVVVSLNWPNPNQVTGNAFLQPANALASTLQNSQQADSITTAMLRGNASALARGGVPFVFASLGGESGATFRDRIITTVEAGMSTDDALRASTVAPAELLGISAAVGTVEAGKLANLVVVQGNDLFARNTTIAHVFVEGRHYNFTGGAASQPGGPGGGGGSANNMRAGAATLSGNGH
jgi:imidazolonepropionase-like amidohydrolase